MTGRRKKENSMTAFEIDGSRKKYDSSVFIMDDDGRVYVDSTHIGFFRHKEMENENVFAMHVLEMVKEGFPVLPLENESDLNTYRNMIARWKAHYHE